MNAICLVIDRLHVGYLGAYGNTWIHTPALDRLAAEGFLFDQFLIDSPQFDRLYRSYWLGQHALLRSGSGRGLDSLAHRLAQRGIATTFVTDEPALARHPLAGGFARRVELDAVQPAGLAESAEQTGLAQSFAGLIEQLEAAREPFFTWCHLRGLGAPWDAPLDYRNTYVDEDDPPPPDTADVPERMLEPDFDPDELLGISQAYAGQVSLLDACLGALDEYLEGSPAGKDTLLIVLSARGFPLGEHLRVGPCDTPLHHELTHAPLLLRFPDGLGAAGRSQALVEPIDLHATLLEWSGLTDRPALPAGQSLLSVVRGEAESLRDRLAIEGPGDERAIVTPAWYLRAAAKPELYARPDDWWQANDVSDRCPDVVEGLLAVLQQYEQALQTGQPLQFPPLDEILRTGLE